MKQPKPWFWAKRNAWYVTLEGKQIRLSSNEREANAEFYRIMAAAGAITDKQAARMTVADLCEALIISVAHARPATIRLYRASLGPFAAEFRSKRLDQVSAEHCLRFVREYQGTGRRNRGFGDSSRALMFRYIKTLYKWAKDVGLTTINNMARVPNPWKIMPRVRPMSEDEYMLLMSDDKIGIDFKEVLEVMWNTGARPGEVSKLSARHLDARAPIARFQPSEHKTGARTGLQREIYFPPDLMDRMRKHAEQRPKGSLLRNSRGNAWTPRSIGSAFRRAKARHNLSEDSVIYLARHAFVTRLVEKGVPLARVAKLAGHTHTNTLMTTYYHPDTEAMMGDVQGINTDGASRVAEIRVKAEALKKKRGKVTGPDTSPGV